MSAFLGLDLATEAGVANWRPGMPWPRAWVLNLPRGADTGIWLFELYRWGVDFVRLEQITDIAVETPLIGMGDAEKNFKLIGAAGVIRMIGAQVTEERKERGGAPCSVTLIANSTMAAHHIGSNDVKGDRRKTLSVLSCHQRGMTKVQNHNIADAIGVLATRLHQLGLEKQVPWDIRKGTANTLFEPKGGVSQADLKAGGKASARTINSALSFDRARNGDG